MGLNVKKNEKIKNEEFLNIFMFKGEVKKIIEGLPRVKNRRIESSAWWVTFARRG